MTRVFGRIGLLSFGGPAAQIALMHRELVEAKAWLTERDFLRALSLCMLLPGPEAMQLATYAGWRLRGTAGGLLAGLLFVGPGAVVITVLALLYASYGQLPLVQAAFLGVKAAVIVVVFQALRTLSAKALTGPQDRAIAGLSFLALFVAGLPFPLVIAVAGLWGLLTADAQTTLPASTPAVLAPAVPSRPLRTLAVWGTLWSAPLLLLWAVDARFLLELGLFFSKLAVVTFGGAYAVLGYMTQTVVSDLGWVSTDQMIDALGLAETTPGPLILVTQFIALLAGFAQGGIIGAIAAGLLALWVTFIPCFLWIFLAGPWLEAINRQPRLTCALRAITCAAVGVIASLALWFALHVLFQTVSSPQILALPSPDWSSFDPAACALTVLAAVLMGGLRMGFVPAMGFLAAAGLGLGMI